MSIAATADKAFNVATGDKAFDVATGDRLSKDSSHDCGDQRVGHNHHIAGVYLFRYAPRRAWRQDHRRADDATRVKDVAALAMLASPALTSAAIGTPEESSIKLDRK